MSSAGVRRLCLAVIAVLYVASVPWYRTPGEAPGLLLGLPSWVAVAVLCYVGVAIMNAIAWMNTDVPETESPADAAGDRTPGEGGP